MMHLRAAVIKKVETKLTAGVDVSNDVFLIMAASIYYLEMQYDQTLRVLNQSDSLEGYVSSHFVVCSVC